MCIVFSRQDPTLNTADRSIVVNRSTLTTLTSPTLTAASQIPVVLAPNHTYSIIGGVAGGVALLFLIGATLLCLRYRTQRETSHFTLAKLVRSHGFDPLRVDGQWNISPVLEKDLYYCPSSSPTKRSSLRPQDSASNICYRVPPPIPAAYSGTSGEVLSSVITPIPARRRNTLRLSVTTLSTSAGVPGSLSPVLSSPLVQR